MSSEDNVNGPIGAAERHRMTMSSEDRSELKQASSDFAHDLPHLRRGPLRTRRGAGLTWCVTMMVFTVRLSYVEFGEWVYATDPHHRDRHGRMLMLNGSSERFAVSVWITFSSSALGICGEP